MRTFFQCLLLFSSCLWGVVFAETEGSLRVATTSGYAPYVSLDLEGNYEGFDIDLAKEICKKVKKKLVIQDLGSMPSILMALKKKKVDAAIWAISITPERQKEMEMVSYQGDVLNDMPFLFWKTVPEKVKNIEDLAQDSKWNVCVEAGSYQDAVVQSYPKLKIKYLDKINDTILELKYSKAIAAPVDHSLVEHIKKQYPEIQVRYFPLAENLKSFGNGICIHKENSELALEISQAVEELKKEGKIQELEKKWGLS